MVRRSTRKAARVAAVVAAPVLVSGGNGVRLVAIGAATLDLPRWPTDVEVSGLAPTITETDTVGAQPTLYRSGEPREQIRLSFVLGGRTLAESAEDWLAAVKSLATAKPVVRLIMGAMDRGTWQVFDAGYTEQEWTGTGATAVAEVIITMKRTDAEVPVGPVPKKAKKSKGKSKKKSTKAKPKKAPKTKTKKD